MKSSIKGGSKDSKSGGFSIIEVLVASSLLVIGVSAVFMACITTMKTQYAANNLYHATCLARNRIQRGLALPFNTLPVLEDSDIHIDQDGHATTEGKFIRSTELKKLSDNAYEIYLIPVAYHTEMCNHFVQHLESIAIYRQEHGSTICESLHEQ